MKKGLLLLVSFLLATATWGQNWDIDALHKVNAWDGKFVRNYNKFVSKSEPYIAIGVPVAMALASWVKHDRQLL